MTETKRYSECAAIELENGRYRLIELAWDESADVGTFDYYHAAFELNGRWNAEFYDETGKSVWAHGSEDSLDFDWVFRPIGNTQCSATIAGIEVTVQDVDFDTVPAGALCQTVDERDNGIPRHWKQWRIV
ncbi:MAG: hypothetical protein VXW49_04915 [Pseudomonadota bacterium]|jgi:hypothetical protein|nr:hypothetical protein [Pseudomonadota bacterium]